MRMIFLRALQPFWEAGHRNARPAFGAMDAAGEGASPVSRLGAIADFAEIAEESDHDELTVDEPEMPDEEAEVTTPIVLTEYQAGTRTGRWPEWYQQQLQRVPPLP